MALKFQQRPSIREQMDEINKKNKRQYNNSVKGLTKDVIVEAEGKKVDYSGSDPLGIKKQQTTKKTNKKTVEDTLRNNRTVQLKQKQLTKQNIGKEGISKRVQENTKRGYAITNSNEIMQNFANKTGSYDPEEYARQNFGTYQLPKKQESLGTKTLKTLGSIPVGMADFFKGAVLNTGEAIVDFAQRGEHINNWFYNKLGLMDDYERWKADQKIDENVARDLSGEAMRALGWDEQNERILKDYSYLTGNTQADKFFESLGEQVPTYMLGYAGSKYMTGGKGVESALTSLKGLRGKELINAAVSNVGKASLLNSGANIPIALTSYNHGYEEALRNGATREQANRYGFLSAATEMVTEWTTGGIPGLENSTGFLSKKAGQLLDASTGNIKNEYLKPIAKSLLKYTGGAAGEGFEEALSEIISPYIKNATYTQGEKVNWDEVAQAALMGMASAGIFSFGQNLSEMAGEIKTVNQKNQVIKQIEQVSNIQVQELQEGVQNGDITPEEGTQAIEFIKQEAQNRINQINQSYENRNNPNAQQNERNKELASQQVEQIQKAVEAGQITPQDGTKQIQDIQNYLRAQEAQTEQQKQTITPQETAQTAPAINETTQDNINTQEEQNIVQNVNNEAEQKPRNVGIHYGDLGKARDTYYWDINSSNRSTGHYGTGTYFLSEQESQRMQDSPFFSRRDRTKNEIDFNDYNLYKPLIEPEARTLHDGLKAINYNNYDDFDYKRMVDDLKRHGITQEQIDNARNEVEETRERYKNEGYNDKYDAKMDSLSTVFMKALGYDGIDVRGLEGYDNTGYGSVIYDLKNKQNQNNEMNQEKLDALTKKMRENRQQRETKAAEEKKILAEKKGNNVITAENYTKDFQDAQTGKLDKKKLRKYVTTSNEATGMQKSIDKADLDRLTYETQSNNATYKKARKNLEGLSYEDRLSRSRNLLSSDKRVTAVDVAEAQITLLEAAQSGNVQDYLDLQQDLAIMGTEAGQTIQAMSMIQKMSPDGQLQTLLKIIDRQQKLGNKNYENVKLNTELVQQVLDSYDDVNHTTFNKEKLDNAMDALKQDVASQMKVSWAEKSNEWRYLSMLGNPKTHIRNMLGNVAMSLVKSVKDFQSAAAQDLLGKIGVIDKSNKTATLKRSSKDVRKLAKEYYSEFQKLEDSGSKYSEKANIEQQRRIFKPALIEWIRKANLKALNVEDNWFKNVNYRKSFSNFLTAKGIRTEADIRANPQIVQDANNYAIQQAKIATFQQDNKVANWIRQADKLGKGAEVVRGAIIPFTSVPMNIAQTGIEYTPFLGAIKTWADFKNAEPGQKAIALIDGIAKQTTGGSLALIGYALAKAGMVTADAGDENEDKFEKDIGAKMNYSIKFGDKSYDLSWLSPSSMPFFVGASMYEQLEKDKGVSGNLITQALASTLDPLSEMSVISSFFNVLDSYEKGAAGKIMKAGESTLQNYVSQYIPTAFSQMAKALDDKKRDTYASKNSPWAFGEETLKQLAYKIPGARNLLPEQKDFLGRTKKESYISDNKIVNAFEAFFSPVNVRKDTSNEVTRELIDIYKKTGGDGLIPNKQAYTEYFKYKKEKYDLSKKEYNEFKEDAGKIATKEIEKLINDSDYQKLSDDKKANTLANVMGYSRYKAKYDYFEDKGIDYYNQTYNKARQATTDGGYAISDYYLNKQKNSSTTTETNKNSNDKNRYAELAKKGIDGKTFDDFKDFVSKVKADKNKKGNSIPGSKKQKIINYIERLNLSKKAKEALYEDYKNNQKTFTTYN